MRTLLPRMVIAGTSSGVGKTSMTLALITALRKRGLEVQTFKVGPDFLDPSYLSQASGRPCYNLDGWMSSQDYVEALFRRVTQDADIAVIEGVMGLFDGADPKSSEGSTAEIARWLEAPVFLIVNAHGQARSLAPLVKGFAQFESGVRIEGVIANQCGSDRHGDWLKASLEGADLPPLLGAIPKGALPTLPSRHLGLVTADAHTLPPSVLDHLASVFEKQVSIELLIEKARKRPVRIFSEVVPFAEPSNKKVHLGYAWDEAFHFYYPDNLHQLEVHGAELIPFSPLRDCRLPQGLDGLYFGGGYPEEYAKVLSENQDLMNDIRALAASGRSIYGECGGLMYLSQGIKTLEDGRKPLVGLIPVWTKMRSRLKTLGYVEVTLKEDSLFGPEGTVLRGHEFHYSELMADPCDEREWQAVYHVRRRRSENIFQEGFQKGNLLASYVHLHWAGRPTVVESFINQLSARS
ncbi:MAG: cobyrinate a,c-diamide synthase [Pseudomonadota bacterium]